MSYPLQVLISTYLEPADVARIAAADPRVEVLYAPDLTPVPRYLSDHSGRPLELDGDQQARWDSMLAAADIAFDFDWQQPERLLDRAPRLRWVQATSAGVGAFMRRTGLHDSELTVTTAGGIHAVPLAEFAVAGALHFIKGIPELERRRRAHVWERYTTAQLAGRTVTVVGLGGMGRQTAAAFHALGTSVIGVGRPGGSYQLPDGIRVVDTGALSEVLPGTDVLVLCCPLTPDTERLIGRPEIDLLPTHSVLINISRGQVVDQDALVEALADGGLGGAALDVFEVEPLPDDSPLWDLENVLISPHSASTVATENTALTTLFIDNLQRWLSDRPLRNTYRRELGY